jgi:O-acetyl-ADP-ribose deacetylase (regulator of RNase III)
MAEPGLWVVNMIAQTGYGRSGTTQHREGADGEAPRPPIRYEALEACLQKVARSAKVLGVSIHMPRIGCSLAGGQWSKVQPIIEKTLVSIDAVVYDFPGSSFNP